MRIGILAPLVTAIREPQLGGSQAYVSDIAQGLAARGHDVEVFAAAGSVIDGVRVVDTGVEPGDLAPALYRATGSGSPDSARSTAAGTVRDAFARAWGLIAQSDHDVVHNHAYDAPAIELARARRVVHTLHLPADQVMAEVVSRANCTVVCVSGPHAEGWSRLLRVDAVIRPGVPVERIPFGPGGERALFAGRISPEKGVVEAVEIARRAGIEIDVYGHPYDADYARAVDARPALTREELWRVMARSRAVLCPVLWDEPFGLVPAESQAAGTPVIGFRRGGLPEVVDDGRTGTLVHPGDVGAAAEALSRAPDFDRSACREHAEANLSLGPSVVAHEDLYERLIE